MGKYCPKDKAKGCNNTKIVKAIQNLLTEMQSDKNNGISPISVNDLEKTKKALDIYISECSRCATQGDNDYLCHRNAKINLTRRLPMISKGVYPWKNYDWNYSNYIDNNYHPDYTGATREGTIKGLYKNANAIVKLINGLIADPIPNQYSKASSPSWDSDYPSIKSCTGRGCKTAQAVKMGFKQKKPYNHPFLNNNTKGINSSSYYYQFGTCPRHDIKTMDACEKKGFTWIPDVTMNTLNKSLDFMDGLNDIADEMEGKKNISKNKKIRSNTAGFCHQPRYGYIDNTAKPFMDGSKLKGLVPALANDLLSLTPDKMLGAMMGASNNSLVLQQCPDTRKYIENFTNENTNQSSFYIWIVVVSIILLIIYFVKN